MKKLFKTVVEFFNGFTLIQKLKERFEASTINAIAVIAGLVASLYVLFNFITFDFVTLLPFAIGAGLVFFWTGILKAVNTPK